MTKLVGHNTDFQGMMLILRNNGASGGNNTQPGLIVGGGGTARAAIYALSQMKYKPIYLVGRNPSKLKTLAKNFPENIDVRVLPSPDAAKTLPAEGVPKIAIGTIPAEQPIPDELLETLHALFERGAEKVESAKPGTPAKPGQALGTAEPVLLEMTYKPPVTQLMEVASQRGWKTVNGLEVLVGQGVYQVSCAPQNSVVAG